MSTVLRKRLDRNWTGIPNSTLRDKRLSFKATGLLAFLLSMDDGWSMDANVVASRKGNHEKRDAVRAGMRELVAAGYARYVKQRLPNGQFVTEVEVSDRPVEDWLDAKVQVGPETGYPAPGEPASAEPAPVDPSLKEEDPEAEETSPNGDCGATPLALVPPTRESVIASPFWQERMPTFERLETAGVPLELLDPEFCERVKLRTDETGVYWDDALIDYDSWWRLQPPSNRRRKRQLQFWNWLKKDVAADRWRQRREEERARERNERYGR